MAKVRSPDADPKPLIGNRAEGCACAYALLQVPQKGEAKAPRRVPSEAGLFNVDFFETSTGTKFERFYCHRGLTRDDSVRTQDPAQYVKRRKLEVLWRAFSTLGRCSRAFLRFILPRVNVGIGINLFRVNGN